MYFNDRGDFIFLKIKLGFKEDFYKRCVYFYVCICVFVSDEKF